MGIYEDVEIDRSKLIKWSGTTENVKYSIAELYNFLQELADDFEMSDRHYVGLETLQPIVANTPYIMELINGYHINDEMAEHLYGGTLIQSDEIYTSFLGDEIKIPNYHIEPLPDELFKI